MSTGVIIGVIVAVVVAALVVWLVVTRLRRRQQLRDRFGPEYDKAVDDGQNRRAAERELGEREKRHEQLDITPLSPTARDGYAQRWALIQAQFVDRPDTAVAEADRLVVVVMGERATRPRTTSNRSPTCQSSTPRHSSTTAARTTSRAGTTRARYPRRNFERRWCTTGRCSRTYSMPRWTVEPTMSTTSTMPAAA